MTALEAIQARHSVRRYLDRPIPPKLIARLQEEIALCNREGKLHIQLFTQAPEAFHGFLATYGMLKGVSNYIALAGNPADDLDERIGYWGEHLVLLAQTLGLNTCWVGGSYSKRKTRVVLHGEEKLVCVIALGYGADEGRPHKSKPMASLCRVDAKMVPVWFSHGMEAALLAPTAINQQHFLFTLTGTQVSAKSTGGPFSNVDLGIVKYHFEVGAGTENFTWA